MSQRLYLNLGNTSVQWGVWDAQEGWVADGRVALRSLRSSLQEIGDTLAERDLIRRIEVTVPVVGSRADAAEWGNAVLDSLGRQIAVMGLDFPVEIETLYHDPAQLGQDRLANLVAARAEELYPCLVLDAGTCLTADVLDGDGVHGGGAIAAGGPALWAGVLYRAPHLAAALSNWPDTEALVGWGRTTGENLALGWELGLRGITAGLVARYREMTDCGGDVILTGGDAGRIAGGMDGSVVMRPLLTLEGLRLAWEASGA